MAKQFPHQMSKKIHIFKYIFLSSSLKLEELDEKAVVYQSVFSQNRGFGLTLKC